MKKLFFSAAALIAFSATSFASEKLTSTTTLDSTSQRTAPPVTCVETRSRINVVTAYEDFETGTTGIQITRVKITTTTCSDGSVTTRQGWD